MGGNIPGLTEDGPIFKDTITVPAGGYVVTRMMATNPGRSIKNTLHQKVLLSIRNTQNDDQRILVN